MSEKTGADAGESDDLIGDRGSILDLLTASILVYNDPMERELSKLLLRRRLTIAVAESCTGGLISHSLTNIPGSSRYFLQGIVAYANEAKTSLVGVDRETLKIHGAVSQEAALELALNVKRQSGAHIGLGVTGIAGPSGGTKTKPVGTVFIAVAAGHRLFFKKYLLKGSRLKIKTQAKDAALRLTLECLL